MCVFVCVCVEALDLSIPPKINVSYDTTSSTKHTHTHTHTHTRNKNEGNGMPTEGTLCSSMALVRRQPIPAGRFRWVLRHSCAIVVAHTL